MKKYSVLLSSLLIKEFLPPHFTMRKLELRELS